VSTQPVTCSHCRNGTIAERRKGKAGDVNRGVDNVAYIPQDNGRTVVIVCAVCNRPIRWKKKRILIVDAA
jgi:hypothetical protein